MDAEELKGKTAAALERLTRAADEGAERDDLGGNDEVAEGAQSTVDDIF